MTNIKPNEDIELIEDKPLNTLEDLEKWWQEEQIMCLARHAESYGGGEYFSEGCAICLEVVKGFIQKQITQDRIAQRQLLREKGEGLKKEIIEVETGLFAPKDETISLSGAYGYNSGVDDIIKLNEEI